MKEVSDFQKLIKRQKAYQRSILVMTAKLFEIQNQISMLTFKELNNDKENEKEESEFLSAKEVCKEYKMSQSTLYRMRVFFNFPYMKIEGRKSILYNKKDIDDYFMKLNKHKL